jgi:hypothetical protein
MLYNLALTASYNNPQRSYGKSETWVNYGIEVNRHQKTGSSAWGF